MKKLTIFLLATLTFSCKPCEEKLQSEKQNKCSLVSNTKNKTKQNKKKTDKNKTKKQTTQEPLVGQMLPVHEWCSADSGRLRSHSGRPY